MNRNSSLRRQIPVIALAIMVLSTIAFAAPEWRGTGGTTTFQQWWFADDDPTPSPSDGWINNYGTPSMRIGDRAEWNDGAWTLGTDDMDILIPNYEALQYKKEIQIELTWRATGQNFLPDRPLIGVLPLYNYAGIKYFEQMVVLEESAATPEVTTVFWVDIWPNPSMEWIVIKGDIDVLSVAIDTRCIPEPATLGLLIGGAFMAIRRGRKIKD